MEKKDALKRCSPVAGTPSAWLTTYPAMADSVDLPDFSFCKNSTDDHFILLNPWPQESILQKNSSVADRIKMVDDVLIKKLLCPMWQEIADLNITFHIIGRRTDLLKITQDKMNVSFEVHWNLLIPYFDQIKELPIVHPEILDIFACAVFHYGATALKHPLTTQNKLISLIIEGYRRQPEFLLASLDIFNKPGIYHIHPTRTWFNRITTVNDRYRLHIDASAAAGSVHAEFLEEVTSFVHKVVKIYAFRYADYLWTQRYRITLGGESTVGMITSEGDNIIINIRPLINQIQWKPAVYLTLGYAIMLAILQAAGKDNKKENTSLAVLKTWNRYLSFGESAEQQGIRDLYKLYQSTDEERCCNLFECMIGQKGLELIDDFIMLMIYSSQESFVERLNILKESRYEKKTGVYFEKLWSTVRNLNTSLMKNNINYSKLIEVLRNDNIDHQELADFLRSGRLGGRCLVDVTEWLLLRTLLYDLINAPKVFRNDYKMLLKVLTKVIKSLIVYIWTLGLDNDARYEKVSSYMAKIMNDIFVFNRVKIYEIVADPAECLEAEAVTGYLLNWANFTLEEQRMICGKVLSDLPRNLINNLCVQTVSDVDQLINVMGIRTSGLFGFYLYHAYRWGSTQDELTERIRSYFPELLKKAQAAIQPAKRVLGGAMLLLLLAQIISDERDGFSHNIVISEEERYIVRDLIRQCVDWDQRHFVMMVAGIAAGYMGSIDGWILQQFDALLARYDGGDRVVLRSVVQYDVDNLIERTLLTAKKGEENELVNKIELLRTGVDPVISDQANKFLRMTAARYGIFSSEAMLQRKNIRKLLKKLSLFMKIQNQQS